MQEAVFMGNYRVCVYAIAKNEEQFVRRWVTSMREADEIYVLDTGSTDQTVELLTGLGVHVTKEEIHPWRFDTARNRSLALVPEDCDICVCTDLDEFFYTGLARANRTRLAGRRNTCPVPLCLELFARRARGNRILA